MKSHFCVETNRNVSTNSLNNVVFDLCLAVLVFPCWLMCFQIHFTIMVMTCDQCSCWFLPAKAFVMFLAFGVVWRMDSQLLRITARSMKTEEYNYFAQHEMRCGFVSHLTVQAASLLCHRENYGEKNGLCRSSIFCSFSRRFTVTNIFTFTTQYLWRVYYHQCQIFEIAVL